MKFIDKSPLRDSFDAYTRAYLRDASPKGTFFPDLKSLTTYQNFLKKEYYKTPIPADSAFNGWLDILMKEQNNLCCYCMRKLAKGDVSVEHLVPETLPQGHEKEEYEYYANASQEINDHVMTGHAFDKLAKDTVIDIDKHVRMPHLIAHSNLFPACNTKGYACSCNNHRGNARILPLMLMPDIESNVKYSEDGFMQILYPETKDRMVEKTLSALDINSLHLRLIRKLWFKFSQKDIFLEYDYDITFIEMDTLIRKALELSSSEVIPLEYQDLTRIETDGSLKNFSLFLKFNWFFTWYKLHTQT